MIIINKFNKNAAWLEQFLDEIERQHKAAFVFILHDRDVKRDYARIVHFGALQTYTKQFYS